MFVVLPAVLAISGRGYPVLPPLWAITVVCLAMLLADRSFDRRQLWNTEHLGRRVRIVLIRFGVLAAMLSAAFAVIAPGSLFALVKARPGLWAVIMFLYPLLSVYPQGIVCRVFLFHRYRPLIPNGWPVVLLSAIAFSLTHMVFRNWPAIALTFVGGVIFAQTYWKTRSLLVSSIEHVLFGWLVFTIGLGWYFYHGAI